MKKILFLTVLSLSFLMLLCPANSKDEVLTMSFVGDMNQLPPVRSAVKRKMRMRTIYYIEILDIIDREVLFRVGCQAGTYIRKLCSDIGKKLNMGAHMLELRSTMVGPFTEKSLCTLQDLTDAYHYYTSKQDETKLRKLHLAYVFQDIFRITLSLTGRLHPSNH